MEEIEVSIKDFIKDIEDSNSCKEIEIINFVKSLQESEIVKVKVFIKKGECFNTTSSAYIIYKTQLYNGYQSNKRPIFNSIEFVFHKMNNYEINYIFELKESYDGFFKSDLEFKDTGYLKYISNIGNCDYVINKEPDNTNCIVYLRKLKDWIKLDFSQIIEYPRGQILGEVKIKNTFSSTYFKLPLQSLFLDSKLLKEYFEEVKFNSYTFPKRIMSLNKYSAYINDGFLYIQCIYDYYQGDNARDDVAVFKIKKSKLLKKITIANNTYSK